MRLRSSFCLMGAICALAGLASAGMAQGQGSPPAALASPPGAAAPLIAPVLPGPVKYLDGSTIAAPAHGLAILAVPQDIKSDPDFDKSVTAAPGPVVKMSAGQWLYSSGPGSGVRRKGQSVTLWISNSRR